jgi:hypothetical protein
MLVELPRDGRYRVRGEIAGHAVSGVALVRPGTKGKALHLVVPGAEDTQG